MHLAATEKAECDAREDVKELDRRILNLRPLAPKAEADATRLNNLVVKTWGMGK